MKESVPEGAGEVCCVFGVEVTQFFNGLLAQLHNKWSAWGIKAAICYDSSCNISELLQLFDVYRTRKTPNKNSSIKIWTQKCLFIGFSNLT